MSFGTIPERGTNVENVGIVPMGYIVEYIYSGCKWKRTFFLLFTCFGTIPERGCNEVITKSGA